jgi:hypothetical protein
VSPYLEKSFHIHTKKGQWSGSMCTPQVQIPVLQKKGGGIFKRRNVAVAMYTKLSNLPSLEMGQGAHGPLMR